LWRDQIDVFFAPGQINLVRSKRGLKPVKLPVITELISDHRDDNQVWSPPMKTLEGLLTEANGAGLAVTLSNHFIRYIVLPPQAEITSPEEVMAYADFRMREIYGTRVDHWALSISTWSPVFGAICAAISQEFLQQMQEMSVRQQVKFIGIEPYLTAVLDRCAQLLNCNKSFVALVERGRICVALLENGVWRNVRNQRVLHDTRDELWAVLDQETVLSGQKEANEEVLLFAPEHPELTLPAESGWHIVSLQTGQMSVPEHYPVVTGKTQSEEDICPV